MRRLLTDSGSGYRSRGFAGACRTWRLRHLAHRCTRAYTPRTSAGGVSGQRSVRAKLMEPLPLIVPLLGGFCWPDETSPEVIVPVMTPLFKALVNVSVSVTATVAGVH